MLNSVYVGLLLVEKIAQLDFKTTPLIENAMRVSQNNKIHTYISPYCEYDT